MLEELGWINKFIGRWKISSEQRGEVFCGAGEINAGGDNFDGDEGSEIVAIRLRDSGVTCPPSRWRGYGVTGGNWWLPMNVLTLSKICI